MEVTRLLYDQYTYQKSSAKDEIQNDVIKRI
jgi:hypothetical protein